MQIVIEIPDEYKKQFDENRCKEKFDSLATNEFGYILRKAFENGTPLPKGHGRLVDADEIQFERTEFETYGDYCIAFDAIGQADTIIEADKEEE